MTQLAAAAATHNNSLLITAALLGIATVVVLITWLKVHPFLALILGSAVLGIVAGFGTQNTIDSFTKGVGATVGSVGLLIALGAMIGGLLADSGGADTVVRSTVDRVSARALPWALAGVAALVGIPLFFEVGVVLLVPIVLLVARRTDLPLMRIGIPALAGLSVLHGFVPPHPGPLVAISALKADLGLTLAFGLLIAIPCVIIAGPILASFISRWVTPDPSRALMLGHEGGDIGAGGTLGGTDLGDPNTAGKPLSAPDIDPYGGPGGAPVRGRERVEAATADGGYRTTAGGGLAEPAMASAAAGTSAAEGGLADTRASTGELLRRPSVVATIVTVLLPVVLMLARAVGELWLDEGSNVRSVLDIIGSPIVALLTGTIVAMFTLGVATGMTRGRISDSLAGSLGPIAGILLIVAAGGGFKQTLVDAGVGGVIADWANGAHISALLLGWLVAVGIRLATGSATVATITAAGIVAPLAAGLDRPTTALLVLAIGAGSLFFSHVNDAGFWLVKEYFGLTVGQTIRSWSLMETVISVVGLGGVMLLSAFV